MQDCRNLDMCAQSLQYDGQQLYLCCRPRMLFCCMLRDRNYFARRLLDATPSRGGSCKRCGHGVPKGERGNLIRRFLIIGGERRTAACFLSIEVLADGIFGTPSSHAERPRSIYRSLVSVLFAETSRRTALVGHLLCALSSRSYRSNIVFLGERRLCVLGRSLSLIFTPQCESAECSSRALCPPSR